MGHAGGPNQALLFALGVVALTSTKGLTHYVALQHRHPDGVRWVEFARFSTKADAQAALEALVEGGHGEANAFRITRIDLPEH